MKNLFIRSFTLLLITIILISCGGGSDKSADRVIIGIPSDVTTFNPMFAVNVNEGSISELIYLGLAEHRWDKTIGDLTVQPLLAESWKWADDSSSIDIKLREDVFWSDSVQFTSDDVLFTFDVYSDAGVQGKFFGIFQNFYTNDDLSINLDKSFEIISPFEIKINFRKNAVPTIYDISYPILPKHIFGDIPRDELANSEANFNPVGTGPYKLSSWEKNQSIKLVSYDKSVLTRESSVRELIFKVVPDYNARLNQLKNGEIDFVEEIKPEDVDELQNQDNLKIEFQKGRNYDYIGWNNIDPESFGNGNKIVPNKFFGDSEVRKALTYAVNRKLIVEEFLNNYADVAVGPIAPIFSGAINENLKSYPFDPAKATELLEKEGWKDTNLDGTIDKNGIEFKFTLYIPAGNPLRNSTATIVKENLKAVGIDVNIESVESQVFWGSVFQKKYNAWIAGWMVPIPLTLKPFWHSDLNSNAVNLASYQNKQADVLLDKMETNIPREELNKTYKEFQKILYNDAPVTFLFWKDNVVAYNNKITGVRINPLGVVHKCWDWSISE